MSFNFNYKLWVATKRDIDHLIRRQNVMKKRDPIGNSKIAFKILSEMFVLYVELVGKLGYLYSKTIQVQKRAVVRNLLESASRSLMTLRKELKNLELSEYVYMNNVLVARKLTPNNIIIWRSPEFVYRRPSELQEIVHPSSENDCKGNVKNLKDIKNAILILQAHEKARQARVYKSSILWGKEVRYKPHRIDYKFSHRYNQPMSVPVKRTIFRIQLTRPNDEKCRDIGIQLPQVKNIDEDEQLKLNEQREKAALKIQKYWRNYREIKKYKIDLLKQKRLYGMERKRGFKLETFSYQLKEAYKIESRSKQMHSELLKLMSDERTRLLQEHSANIMEDISDHIREWLREFYEKTGDFHPYPEISKQGTVLVLLDESMNLEEFKEYQIFQKLSKEERKARMEKEKQKKANEKEKIKKQKLKEAKQRKKLKDSGMFDIADLIGNNKDMGILENTLKQYSIDWKNVDEYLNKEHKAIEEWITESEMAVIHKDLRYLVDEFMRLEYEQLKQAWCMDNKKPYKPPKVKQKNAKEVSQKKKKKIKDLEDLDQRSIESLYQELCDNGIIEKFPYKSLQDYFGEYNFLADDSRDADNLVSQTPRKGDLKLLLQEYILGYGEFPNDKPKSICLIGPRNSGKTILCHIIASELDAVFMNLSPEKTLLFASKLQYFLNLIMRVAKAFQPTILFIDNAHRLYWKKIPKDQTYLQPTLLQNALSKKILKNIRKDDRILVLATSNEPWSAKPKFQKVFEKILLLPKSDYGTIYLMWYNLLSQRLNEGVYKDYMMSSLTLLLRLYEPGDIFDSIENTLNIERCIKLHSKSLNPLEFIDYFIQRNDPIFPPQENLLEKFEKWWMKTNSYSKMKAKVLMAKQAKNAKKK
ncbi:dynein regulatory complex protein 11 [Haematobia irritans]|uniref:dynein regulatory complex protein 11 n=1 Tax=Haematobia irritans TaxID=7368 RepID=UPI003F50ACA0